MNDPNCSDFDGLLDANYEILYQQLRETAHRWMRGEPAGHTLDATALVHESYLRLHKSGIEFESADQFLAYAAIAMRRILIERARRIRALRRGGDHERLPLSRVTIVHTETPLDIEALDDALNRLGQIAPAYSDVVMLRFLLGRSVEETARALRCSPAKVKKDWKFAKAWLQVELGLDSDEARDTGEVR
ncbi:MAG: sigma-70 family RNA polymerase sigma factor [Planctomycetes bacterium]|nr:sigma-70 family RNA polymerase sigma factor [Planctomycetota bacterium]